MQLSLRCAAALAATIASSSCGTFREQHLFATVNSAGETQNIFRIRVSGDVQITNARYLAGYYDERAVDTFFNESKSVTLDAGSLAGIPPIFAPVPCKDPGRDECKQATAEKVKLVPLGSKDTGEGAFVMILSTNPDAIVSTIGSFVDNDIVVQSAMFLATRGDRERVAQSAATKPIVAASRSAVFTEVEQLLADSESAGAAAGGDDTNAHRVLGMLQALAAGLAPTSAPRFTDADEARTWFAAVPRGVGE